MVRNDLTVDGISLEQKQSLPLSLFSRLNHRVLSKSVSKLEVCRYTIKITL